MTSVQDSCYLCDWDPTHLNLDITSGAAKELIADPPLPRKSMSKILREVTLLN